jgi:hypothetical protein
MIDDHRHGAVRVVQMRQLFERAADDVLLETRREKDQSLTPRPSRSAVAVGVAVLRPPPLVRLEDEGRGGDHGHEHRIGEQ